MDSYGYGARARGIEVGCKLLQFAMQTKATSPFIAGALSLAELYLAPILGHVALTLDFAAVATIPGFDDWWTKVQALPSYQATNPLPKHALLRSLRHERSRTRDTLL